MKNRNFVSPDNAILVVLDVQEKLLRAMHEKERLFDSLQKIIRGSQVLDVPVMVTEQNPQGLGQTIPEIKSLLPDIEPIVKFSFSCCGEKRFLEKLKQSHRKHILITGIESHICVYQSCVDLLGLGYCVQVITDCVSSRTPENRMLGIQSMLNAGAESTGTEMILFELLKTAQSDKFKAISRIIR